MMESYNPYLVALSLGVAILGFYTVFDVAARVRRLDSNARKRRTWVMAGAWAMGNGIWSMHFLRMLACGLPMEMSYNPLLTILSLLPAIAVAYFALHMVTRGEPSVGRVAGGGALVASGLAAMHYGGMAAVRVEPGLHYRPGPVIGSLMIALVSSIALIGVMFLLRDGTSSKVRHLRRGAAIVGGLAVAAMHYVAMSAASLPNGAVFAHGGLGTPVLATMVGVFSVCSLTATLVLSMLDTHFDQLMLSAHEPLQKGLEQLHADGRDQVTGIGNRATFLQALEQRMTKAESGSKLLGLVFLDLDGFKTINDSLGYTAGDEVLRAFSQDLQRRVRQETALGRMGGDEFALVVEGFDEPGQVETIVRSILERVQTEFSVEGAMLRVTASAGVALFPRDGKSVDALLKSASVAMHCAKEQGKNSFSVFDPTMSDAVSRTHQITRGLGEAMAQHQFSLVFQPKFGGSENTLVGAEALIRWHHPTLGNVSPMEFIPVAEQTGQIVPVSEWVIGECCRQIEEWRGKGLPRIKVAINLSPEQLRLTGYAERVLTIVEEAGADPRSIMFEITETAAMREPKLATAAIAEFQRAGFDFAIDDFGTGYSSMAYLQQFRVKELKIDRFFIGSLEDGTEEGHTIVAAIIALAHALHMTVVAEGVETLSQLKKLQAMHCDQVQGYLLGRPMTPQDFEKLLHGDCTDELAKPLTARAGMQAAPPKPRLLPSMA